MYNRFIRHEKIPGINDVETLRREVTWFLTTRTTKPGITLFITHDILIAMYHYALAGKVYQNGDGVAFLSGIFLKNGRYEGKVEELLY
ncbi:MAG: hypothetical protein ACUVRD_09230 [Bacteroidia bacterium]